MKRQLSFEDMRKRAVPEIAEDEAVEGDEELPEGWARATVGDLADFHRGVSFKKEQATNQPGGGRIPVLRAGNLQNGRIVHDDVVYVSPDCVASSQLLRPGDIVIAMSSGSASVVGKAAVVSDSDVRTRLSFGAFCGMWRPRSATIADWLRIYFQSPRYRQLATKEAVGVNINNLRESVVSEFALPIPPENAITSIATRFDALSAKAGRARSALDEVPALLEKLRQSILAAAFRGDLTAEWREANPDVESAEELVERTPAPSGKSTGRAASNSVQPGRYAVAVGNPNTPTPHGWAWVPLSRVAQMGSGHTPSREHEHYWNGDVPWVGIADARENHGRVIDKTFQTITEEGLANSAARLLPAMTVCLSRTASVGYVTIMGREMATSQDFANWTCTEALLPKYLMYALLAEGDGLRDFGEGSTHTTIYFPELKAFHICLAPLEEQRRIVELIEARLAAVEAIAKVVAEARAAHATIDRSLLAKAFRGELVPQDPDDEPASVMLARLREERAEAPTKTRVRRRARGTT